MGGSGGRWGSGRFRLVRTRRRHPPPRAVPSGCAAPVQRRSALRSMSEAFREKEYARDTLNFTLRLAEAMFHYGADAMDVDSAIIGWPLAYGLDRWKSILRTSR